MGIKGNPLFILLASLAVVGLVSQLMFNTQGFIMNLLVTVLVVALFIVLYQYLTRKPKASTDHRAKPKRIEQHRLTRHRQRAHNFRVIEGSKGKKNKPHSS